MNRRFVWNFEIDSDHLMTFPVVEDTTQAHVHWESRFFWSDQDVIILGLAEHFLELSQFKLKRRHDNYFLLPDADYNIKIRKDAWFYKPIIERSKSAIAFGRKIKLQADSAATTLEGTPLNLSLLFEQLNTEGQSMEVYKEALIHTFEAPIPAKMELARLIVNNQIYFSVSIESQALSLVEHLSRQIVGNHPTSDYLSFLKKLLPS